MINLSTAFSLTNATKFKVKKIKKNKTVTLANSKGNKSKTINVEHEQKSTYRSKHF